MMSVKDSVLQLPQGNFQLARLPKRAIELLRAWDAADEYVLTHLVEQGNLTPQSRLLIFNDSFGGLAVPLQQWQPTAISDSYLSQQATRLNLIANGFAAQAVNLRTSLDLPTALFDVVIIKAPKTLAYLEDFLIRLQPCLHDKTQLIVAGMVKNLPAKVWTLVEQLIGKTTTSLARKKARLIFATPDAGRDVPQNRYPVCYPLENSTYQLVNHANVFSRDSLDIGTRFLLAHLPKPNAHDEIKQIVDLGCGNGVVGLLLAEHYPEATLHFVDESFMAIASAQTNFQQSLNPAQGKFYVCDGLTEFASDSMDLIVCNPPFHQQQTLGDQIAWSLFKHAKRVLKQGGQFWVIGNRHLAYQQSLRKLFTQPVQVTANAKFEIIKMRK